MINIIIPAELRAHNLNEPRPCWECGRPMSLFCDPNSNRREWICFADHGGGSLRSEEFITPDMERAALQRAWAAATHHWLADDGDSQSQGYTCR